MWGEYSMWQADSASKTAQDPGLGPVKVLRLTGLCWTIGPGQKMQTLLPTKGHFLQEAPWTPFGALANP